MENYLNKSFKYKGGHDIKIVKEIKNNKVYFTDNGSTDFETFVNKFELYSGQHQVNTPVNQPIQHMQQPQTYSDPLQSNLGGLLNQIEEFKNNPQAFKEQSNTTYSKSIGDSGEIPEGISRESYNQVLESERLRKLQLENNKKFQENDPWMKQFDEFGTEIKRIDTDQYKRDLEEIQQQPYKPLAQLTNQNNKKAFPPMKKTFKVKLYLELNEMIPKLEDIKAVESVLDISIIEGLAIEISEKYLNDRELFQNMIQSELENLIKKKTKKPVKKKTRKIKPNNETKTTIS